MIIKKIIISNFRNYKQLELELGNKINIIYGENGVGKTNLLEAIYVLGITKSHRSFIDNNLIKESEKNCKIKGNIFNKKISNYYEIEISNNNKKLLIDNIEIKKVSDYLSKINIIIFYPDDLEIIKGSPNVRRKFLNVELSQLYSNYINILNEFYKLLKTRNDYLKKTNDLFDQNYFDILTEYLIEREIILYKMRSKFIDKINEKIGLVYFKISGIQNLKIIYKTSIDFENYDSDYLKKLLRKKYKEIYLKEKKLFSTLIGPHRDDFEFYIGNQNLKNYGSQGQQRLAILALKLSEIEIFKKYKGTNPILLLDDVFSEIDDYKKNKLLKYIKGNIQSIITTTEINSISNKIIESANIYNIKNGEIKLKKEVQNGRKNAL